MLIGWLDRRIDHADIPAGESAVFLRKAILGLMASFGIEDVTTLALDRFRLRDQVEMRIQRHREEERDLAFKQWLLPGSALVVAESKSIHFAEIRYEPGWNYEGGFQFKNHYKGTHLSGNDDSAEKRAVGEVWASRSQGKCLFVMPKGADLEEIRRRIRCR